MRPPTAFDGSSLVLPGWVSANEIPMPPRTFVEGLVGMLKRGLAPDRPRKR